MTNRKSIKAGRGNLQLSLRTKNAKGVLTHMGQVLAPKLSKHFGGVEVKPMVSQCKQLADKWRLMLVIPKGLESETSQFDVFDKTESGIRIWGVPLEFLVDNTTMEFLKIMHEYQKVSRISKKGEVMIRLEFASNEDNLAALDQAKDHGLIVKNPELPRRGSKKLGFHIVAPVIAETPKDVAPKQQEGFSPDAVYEFIWKGFSMLPADHKQKLISSVIDSMNSEERLRLISGTLPEGVGLYDTNSPFKQNGVGMVVNKLVFEEEG